MIRKLAAGIPTAWGFSWEAVGANAELAGVESAAAGSFVARSSSRARDATRLDVQDSAATRLEATATHRLTARTRLARGSSAILRWIIGGQA